MQRDDDLSRTLDRIKALEDTIAIYQLVSAYGPAVDSDSRDWASELWAADGEYLTDGPILRGADRTSSRGDIEEMLGDELHQGYLAGGCAHVMSLPHVRVADDRAIAVGYQQVTLHENGRYRVHRMSVHTFYLERIAGEWLIRRRTARRINGSERTREALRDGLRGDICADEGVLQSGRVCGPGARELSGGEVCLREHRSTDSSSGLSRTRRRLPRRPLSIK